jgi:predicted CoA-binding protein
MSQIRSVAVLGASQDRRKYSNKAVRAYLASGWRVFPVTPASASVEGLPAFPKIDEIPESIDAVTVYVPAAIGVSLLPGIAAKKPREVWFNPGAESSELQAKAAELGLPAIYGCSIVALGRSPSDFPDE